MSAIMSMSIREIELNYFLTTSQEYNAIFWQLKLPALFNIILGKSPFLILFSTAFMSLLVNTLTSFAES